MYLLLARQMFGLRRLLTSSSAALLLPSSVAGRCGAWSLLRPAVQSALSGVTRGLHTCAVRWNATAAAGGAAPPTGAPSDRPRMTADVMGLSPEMLVSMSLNYQNDGETQKHLVENLTSKCAAVPLAAARCRCCDCCRCDDADA